MRWRRVPHFFFLTALLVPPFSIILLLLVLLCSLSHSLHIYFYDIAVPHDTANRKLSSLFYFIFSSTLLGEMRKNPYLAHYFGAALDSSFEEEGINAAAHFAYFPNSKHMTQRVFCPSRESERSNGSSTAVCTPPSNVTPGIRVVATRARDGFPSSPPEYTNRLPPLPLSASRRSTPVEVSTDRQNSFHTDLSIARSNSPMGICTHQTPERPSLEIFNREAPGWGPMIRQSHAALAEVRELLGAQKATPAVSMPVANGVISAVESDGGHNEVGTELKVSPATSLYEWENTKTVTTSSCVPMSCAENHSVDVSLVPQSTVALPSAEVTSQRPAPNVSSREEEKSIVPNSTSSPDAPKEIVHRPDPSALQQSAASAPLQVNCFVLTLNPDAVACALKRLSRQPPYVSTIQNNESTVQGESNVPEKVPPVVSTERPKSQFHCEKRKSKSKGRDRKDGVISVASLYGILERLADVVRPQPEGRSVDSSEKKGELDGPFQPPRSLNVSGEKGERPDTYSKERSMREPVVAPKVLMGNAPRIEGGNFPLNDHREAFNSIVPTSQLQFVGVNAQRPLYRQRRASSARRPSVSRAPRTPSYALPTESWLCKGAELNDAPVDASFIMEGSKTKGALR
ncbi:UDP-Gal or UDP-GlcNAc-dependent glycosyltransferase, putative [Trypanosoma cruzi marinkellei]|uniref:UDP-Gal or UDP-GlcNAc-dependent glycosyltransferase, putative n=1 Tax=Trypanosoma cruzi marinkellei TaxID=85056 RepID=K2MXL9_TRYCR|nr:UDP-Gal or UDP-GlcNAc-dependent glycosyltransferase, putative [Trypanosoma cruzi marinkellei]